MGGGAAPPTAPGVRLLPEAQVRAALRDTGGQIADLFRTRTASTWDAPAQVFALGRRGRDGQIALLTRAGDLEAKGATDTVTLYRYRQRGVMDDVFGLATTQSGSAAGPSPDPEKVRALAARLGADALLLCQVGEAEVVSIASSKADPFLIEERSSEKRSQDPEYNAASDPEIIWINETRETRLRLRGVLVSGESGAVLQEAQVTGRASETVGLNFLGKPISSESSPDEIAAQALSDGLWLLVTKLWSGTAR
jgi:hypothetical protein